jgi:hypothetical protein
MQQATTPTPTTKTDYNHNNKILVFLYNNKYNRKKWNIMIHEQHNKRKKMRL